LTDKERTAIAHPWDKLLKEQYVLQFVLDLLVRQENEGRNDADFDKVNGQRNDSGFSFLSQYHHLRIAWRPRIGKTRN